MRRIRRDQIERLTNNNTFANWTSIIITFILGIISTLFFDRTVVYKEYIPINNITLLYEKYLVSTGLVNEDILAEYLNPVQQIEYIREAILKLQADNKSITKDAEVSYNSQQQEYEELQNKYQQITQEKAELEQYLKTLTTAELSETNVIVLGESQTITVKDFIATINGHIYYLEDFLNQILPESISYRSDYVYYGKSLPERVNVVKQDKILANNDGFLVYNQNDSFYMGGVEYNSGLVLSETWQDCSIYINANKKYSKLIFTLGHIDNSNTSHRTLKISYLNADGEYVPIKFDCYGGMPREEKSVDIFNTETIKIEVPIGNYEQFGLADIYLVK